jgi:hypothetical protein
VTFIENAAIFAVVVAIALALEPVVVDGGVSKFTITMQVLIAGLGFVLIALALFVTFL